MGLDWEIYKRLPVGDDPGERAAEDWCHGFKVEPFFDGCTVTSLGAAARMDYDANGMRLLAYMIAKHNSERWDPVYVHLVCAWLLFWADQGCYLHASY